jgi:KDO2-lipid IV(A) lauroyltransferase
MPGWLKRFLMRLATIFGAFSPPWFVKTLAFFFSLIAFLCLRGQRNRVKRNLSYIGNSNPKRQSFQLFQNLGLCIAHFLQSPSLVDKIIPYCEFNLTPLRKAQKKGKAVLLITAHFGNWELAGLLLKRLGFPLSVIAEPLKDKLFETYNYYRHRFGVEVIPYDQPKKLLSAIKRKRVIVFLADRSLSGKGVEVSFFGKRRIFPKGPAFFSLRYGLPIVPGYILLTTPPLFFRDKKGRYLYRIVAEEEISFLPSGDFENDLVRLTERIAKKIEEWVRREPTQWFVFEAEWRDETN